MKKIEKKLNKEISSITPDIYNRVNSADSSVISGNFEGIVEQSTEHTEKMLGKSRRVFVRTAYSLCALAVILAVFFSVKNNYIIDSTILLDVNPSIELELNAKDKVIKADAQNSDGASVIAGLDLKGLDYRTAVSEILSTMIEQGYIDHSLAALITIDNNSSDKIDIMKKAISDTVENTVNADGVEIIVMCQKMDKSDKVLDYAKQKGISPGKAQFCLAMEIDDDEIEIDMASIDEIIKYSMQKNEDLMSVVDSELSSARPTPAVYITPLPESGQDNAETQTVTPTVTQTPVVYVTPLPDKSGSGTESFLIPTPITSQDSENTAVPTGVPTVRYTKEGAIAKALTEAGSGEVVEYSYDVEDACHEISIRIGNDEYEYELSEITGRLELREIDRNEETDYYMYDDDYNDRDDDNNDDRDDEDDD